MADFIQNPREWIESLSEDEHTKYFNYDYIYLKKNNEDNTIETYGDLASLYIKYGDDEAFDFKIPANEFQGCYLDEEGNIILGRTLEDYKLEKTNLFKAVAEELIKREREGYLDLEIESWSKQEQGALDLQADPESTTDSANFVRNLANSRGIELNELVRRILNNVTASSTLVSTVLGKLQRTQDRIALATTKAELDEITWDN